MRRVRLELLPELRDEHPQVLGLVDGVRSLDGLQNRTMRQHAVAVVGQERQQIELLRRQADLFFAAHHAMPVIVDGDVAVARSQAVRTSAISGSGGSGIGICSTRCFVRPARPPPAERDLSSSYRNSRSQNTYSIERSGRFAVMSATDWLVQSLDSTRAAVPRVLP